MDNPRFENDDGNIKNSVSYNGNNQTNSDTIKTDVALTVDEIELSKFSDKQKVEFDRHTFRNCTRNLIGRIKNSLFILQWLPAYSRLDVFGDLLAGITIGLTIIPQSMALAGLVGVPAQYGLYTSFLGTFIYSMFGTSKVVPMGPTAIIALLVNNTIGIRGPVYATLLCFLTGLIQTLMSFAGLGFIINFISEPVCSGFTSASAILIVISQIKDLIGIKGSAGNMLNMCRALLTNIGKISIGDTIMGCLCIATVELLKVFSTKRVGPKDQQIQTQWQKNMNKIIWAVGAFRNSIVVIVCSIICYWCVKMTNHDIESNTLPPIPFKIIGKIPYGLPSFGWPEFSTKDVNGKEETFFDMIVNMGSGIIVLPLVSLLEDISLCKTFADGKSVDTNQELLAIGLSNIGNSLVHGFAGSGGIARGALNYSSGVRTPLGGLYTGICVMAALVFLTPFFYYVPKTSLAAVIIPAAVVMIDVKVVKYVYKLNKKDLILLSVTFFACLFLQLEIGVLVGIIANIGFILCSAAKPKITYEIITNFDGIKYLLFTPDRYLIYPSIEYVRKTITKNGLALGVPVVVNGSNIFETDFTTANAFSIISQDFSNKGQSIYMYNLKPSVFNVFKGTKNCSILLCANKEELDEQLRKQFESGGLHEILTKNEAVGTLSL